MPMWLAVVLILCGVLTGVVLTTFVFVSLIGIFVSKIDKLFNGN